VTLIQFTLWSNLGFHYTLPAFMAFGTKKFSPFWISSGWLHFKSAESSYWDVLGKTPCCTLDVYQCA